MTWQIDEHGRLVITVSPEGTAFPPRRDKCEPAFESDDFMHDLLGPC